MSLRLRILPRAEADAQHIFDFIREWSPQGARAWWTAFEDAAYRAIAPLSLGRGSVRRINDQFSSFETAFHESFSASTATQIVTTELQFEQLVAMNYARSSFHLRLR